MTRNQKLRSLAVVVVVALALLAVSSPVAASHLKGYDLSHSINTSGTVTFVYKAYHINNLKYPTTRPATGARYLQFGDGGNQAAIAEAVVPAMPFCDLDAGVCRMSYLDCPPPGNDARLCDTAVTTRIFTHDYACGSPATSFTAFITRTDRRADRECCRADDFINIPESGRSSIDPANEVFPCCDGPGGDPNNGPQFTSLPVFNAFQNLQYRHPLGASDPEGDPLVLDFLTQFPLANYSCPAICPAPTTPNPITLTAFDPCQDPAGAVMTIDPTAKLDWNLPISGLDCDQTRLGLYGVAVGVTDTCGATAAREYAITLFEEPTTNPPVLVVTPATPPGLVDICIDKDIVSIALSADDADLADTVTLLLSPTGVANTTFTTVSGNPATGTFTFEPKSADLQLGTFGFTFTAQDDGSPVRTAQESVSINVIDCDTNLPPVAESGGPYVGECGQPTVISLDGTASTDPDGDPLTYQWFTSCPGTFSDPLSATPVLTLTGNPPCPRVCGLTLRVFDDHGHSDNDLGQVRVLDTIPPVVDPIADLDVACDLVPAPPVAVGVDAVLILLLDQLFEVTPIPGRCTDAYTLHRNWTFTDDCGNQSVETQDVRVDDLEAPVLAGVPADATVECDAIPTASVTVHDDCDPTVAVVTGEVKIPGTTCANGYQLDRTFTATDRCGNAVSAVQKLTVVDTTPPTLSGVPADATVECDAIPAVATTVVAIDTCPGTVAVAFVENRIDGTVCANAYVLERTWTATDECGNTATAVQTLTVVDTTPPTLSGVPADATVECDAVPAVATTVVATDTCPGPVAIGFVENRIDGPVCANAYVLERTWTATDECGNSMAATQRLTVIDTTPPVFAGVPADATVECDAVPAVATTVVATDTCPGPVAIGFVETRIDGTVCVNAYVLERTWTATDGCGNATTAVQRLTVIDTTPPVFAGVPADGTVECDAVPAVPTTVAATDSCPGAVTLSFVETRIDGSCDQTYSLIRTWTAVDACGNDAVAEQRLEVVDTTPPAFVGLPVDASVECDAVTAAPTVTASDACAGSVAVGFTEVRVDGRCDDTYTLERTWTAVDPCGNTASHTQVLQVIDSTPPVLAGIPADTTAECDALPASEVVTAADSCDPKPTVSFAEARTAGSCADSYTLTRTWTGTDRCGNSAAISRIVTVVDSTPPAATALLVPLPAIPPGPASSAAAPRPAASACSAPSSRSFTVGCGASDNCDPSPSFAPRLVVTNHDVVGGACVERVEMVPVACGEVIELRLLQAPCPAKPARSSPTVVVKPTGVRVVSGEAIVLEVQAVDRCGNIGSQRFDPTVAPLPPCVDELPDGTCCPLLGPLADPKCDGPLCGRSPGPPHGR